MPVNRYRSPIDIEYQSQHVPLPFEELAQIGAMKQKTYDTAQIDVNQTIDELSDALKAAPWAEDLKSQVAQEYNSRINNLAEKAGQNPAQATIEANRLRSQIKADPRIYALKESRNYWEKAYLPKTATKDYDQQVDPNRDIKTGEFYQSKDFNELLQPKDTGPDVIDYNQGIDAAGLHLKPVIEDVYREGNIIKLDPETGKHYVQTTSGKRLRIDDTTVGKAAEEEARTFLQSPESEYFKEVTSRKFGQNPNLEFTKDYIISRWTKNFQNQEDTTQGVKFVSGEGKDGAGKRTPDEVLNPFIDMVSPKTTAVSDENLDGIFRKNSDGSHTVPIQGSIINFAKTSGANPEVQKINSFGKSIYDLKAKYGYTSNPKTVIVSLEKNDPKNDYYITGNDIVNKKDKSTGKVTRLGNVQDVINNEIKATPEYALLKDQASEQGVDISDKDFDKKYKESLGKYTEEIQNELGKILEIGGDAKFIVDPGDNKINVDDNVFVSGKAILSESDLNERFSALGKTTDTEFEGFYDELTKDDWQDVYLKKGGSGYGAINYYGQDEKGENLYSIDIKKQIPIERTIARSYNKAAFGESFNSKVDTDLNNSFNEFIANNIQKKRDKIYNNSYDSNPSKFKESVVTDINSLDETSKQDISKLTMEIDKEKDLEKRKRGYIELKKLLQNKEELPIFLDQLKKKDKSVAVATNNPGNIKYGDYAKNLGAKPSGRMAIDGGEFAEFDSPEQGLTAMKNLLKGSGYKNLTVDAALKRWSNSGYGAEIYPEISNKKISDLTNSEFDELIKKQIRREDIDMYNKLFN